MSLCSRLIKLPRKVRVKRLDSLQYNQMISCQNRLEFQNYFTDLMNTSGTTEKSNSLENYEKSEEELLWQSELKGTFLIEMNVAITYSS